MFPNLDSVIVEQLSECRKQVILKPGSDLALWFGGNTMVLLLPGGPTMRSRNKKHPQHASFAAAAAAADCVGDNEQPPSKMCRPILFMTDPNPKG